jgi:hypothetical protein
MHEMASQICPDNGCDNVLDVNHDKLVNNTFGAENVGTQFVLRI